MKTENKTKLSQKEFEDRAKMIFNCMIDDNSNASSNLMSTIACIKKGHEEYSASPKVVKAMEQMIRHYSNLLMYYHNHPS